MRLVYKILAFAETEAPRKLSNQSNNFPIILCFFILCTFEWKTGNADWFEHILANFWFVAIEPIFNPEKALQSCHNLYGAPCSQIPLHSD